MYEIKIESGFSAAHNLRGYKGKCEELHGHNWKVEASLKAEYIDKIGMVCDFKILKEKLNSVLKDFDHSYLNKHKYFKKVNPTSENVARYIYDRLSASLKGNRLAIGAVKVWENQASCASYYEK